MKRAILHSKVREALKAFPHDVRREIGKAIWDLQEGHSLGMPLSRPMPSVAQGVFELRVRDREGIYRAFYYTKSPRGILVFHAFQKKAQQTPEQEIKLGRKRLMETLNEEEE